MPIVTVTQLGAVGNGLHDDAPAIQQALDGAKRHIFVPAGVYKIGSTLRISSHTRLDLHPQARLFMADGAGTDVDAFLLTNRDHEQGNSDIEITGGIWDGNNAGNPRVKPLVEPGAYTGVLINFRNVRRLTFAHALLANAESYYLRLTAVTDFLIEHLRFHSVRPRNNNDGVHLAGFCENGLIRHIRGLGPFAPNDDMVALNADDALQRVEVAGGLCGPIRNLTIYDLHADHCHTFVRMLSVVSPIENVTVDHVRGGCDVTAVNMDGCRGCRVQVFDPEDPRFARGVGALSNIRISDLDVFKTAANATALLNLQEMGTGVTITRVRRDLERDAAPGAPTLAAQHMGGHRLDLEGLTAGDVELLRASSTAPVAAQESQRGYFTTQALTPDTAARLYVRTLSRLSLTRTED